ncbi:hypothetical protein [Virgibacillus pantothenticus]|uniref:hypothetical protein n=1 Tax=Virgibacillus pantothenticus TaxID=1473 RepID=UPI0009869B9C|nr:hypothetical protein [Virgibacillus pantothenticus]
MNNHIKDLEAATISENTYQDDVLQIKIKISDDVKTSWYPIETIKSPDTGLDGYVLQNPDTNEIVIIFRGQNQILLKLMKKIFLELFLVIPIIPKENMEKHLI